MNLLKTIKKLCIPAKFYLAISIISILALLFDPSFSSPMGVSQQISIFKILFIVVWTYILDLVCKAGYVNVSWFFVLLPFIILLAIIVGSMISCPNV